ncbi:hypothetical protein DQQ10_16470 [Pseudochryseolinea flava]|uniref:Uncharacterized protein n=2 Tax=Pseudochryseolinea flava TaxID=2059302 RepID=A0A364Y038_9BACT|nr:hypothetical protein DQQ10_16470 [Pseudochryseolinea flava]
MLITKVLVAQNFTPQDVFKNENMITWLGIDFSKAKILEDAAHLATEKDIQGFMFNINALMLSEKHKFDITGALDRDSVINAIDISVQKNKSLTAMDLRIQSVEVPPVLKRAELDAIVKSYDFKGLEGIGVMFNIDQFNKHIGKGTMWVTFVDMKSKSILFADHFSCVAKGFGMRNFWASTIYGTIKDMKRGTYNFWRKKYKKGGE